MKEVIAVAVVDGKVDVMLARRCERSPPPAVARASRCEPRPSITKRQTFLAPAISSGASAASGT